MIIGFVTPPRTGTTTIRNLETGVEGLEKSPPLHFPRNKDVIGTTHSNFKGPSERIGVTGCDGNKKCKQSHCRTN